MKEKFIVYRMDMFSRKIHPLRELLRFVKVDGKLVYDRDNSLLGRGYYLYNDEKYIREMFQKKKSRRFFGDMSVEEFFKEIHGDD